MTWCTGRSLMSSTTRPAVIPGEQSSEEATHEERQLASRFGRVLQIALHRHAQVLRGEQVLGEADALLPVPSSRPQVDGVDLGLSLHARRDICPIRMSPMVENGSSAVLSEAGEFHGGREAAPLPCVPVLDDRT